MNPTTNVSSGAAKLSAGMTSEEYQKRIATLEKPWAEATIEEKLEKVREELIQLGHMSYSISNNTQEIQKLKEHSHQDGKIVVPLTSPNLGIGLVGASRRNNLA